MFEKLNRFITPDRNASWWVRMLPYLAIVAFGLIIFAFTGAAWEYTNSSGFCGTTCHTMPPQYESYLHSPHARIACVECHIGRGLIATQFTRKAGDLAHVFRYIGAEYEAPIYIKHLRPSDQICERCHNPDNPINDQLRQIVRFDAAQSDKPSITYLAMRVGGGLADQGYGQGIHWHVNNPVEYIATDDPHLEQEIPWVRVTDPATGESLEYVDIEANLPADFVEQNQDHIKTVDCGNCHNRVAHEFPHPADAIDRAMARGAIPTDIPYFKQNAVAVMERPYPTMDDALAAIRGLGPYYQTNWPDYMTRNAGELDAAIEQLITLYERSVFPDMAISWDTYPDNLEHKEWAGCFRCHDGKHINQKNETIRLECNLCHSIPLKDRPDGTRPLLPVEEPFEPESHRDSNWMSAHRFSFDDTCQGCHTTANPGGTDNSSYCANSGCHATEWKFTGVDSPKILEISNVLNESLPRYPDAPLNWFDLIGPILENRCVPCHGSEGNAAGGLYLNNYAWATTGGSSGPAIILGNGADSPLVTIQQEGHPNRLPPEALGWLIEWIDAGAPRQ